MTFREFAETDTFKNAHCISTVNQNGVEIDENWIASNTPVLEVHDDHGYVEVMIKKEG